MRVVLTALLLFGFVSPAGSTNLTTKEYFSELSPEQRRAYLHGAIDMAILEIRLKESTKQAACLSDWFSRNQNAYEKDLNTFLRANDVSTAADIIGIFVHAIRECSEHPPIHIPPHPGAAKP